MSKIFFKVPGPGATPLYDDPNVLAEKIQEYFDSLIDVPVTIPDGKGGRIPKIDPKTGQEMFENKRPLVYGLALYLGFCNRQSLNDYKKRSKAFSFVIEAAISYISSFHEDNVGSDRNSSGSQFFLKNHGWTDKIDANVNNNHSGSIEMRKKVVFSFKDMPGYIVKINTPDPSNEEVSGETQEET